jgi:hypothetical protein
MRKVWLAAFLLASCASPSASFNPNGLKPTAEAAPDITLAGWLHTGNAMRLYSTEKAFKTADAAACISIRPLSTAGVVPADYEGKQMAVTGRIVRGRGDCKSGMTLIAADMAVP